MEYSNAFRGKANQPTDAEVAAALGSTAKLWNDFILWMADKEGITAQEWKGIVVNKYGWSLRLKRKARNIVYLGPGHNVSWSPSPSATRLLTRQSAIICRSPYRMCSIMRRAIPKATACAS